MIEFMLEVTLVGSLALAIIILASDSRRLANRLFAAIALLFALWSLSILLFDATTNTTYALQYARLFYIGSVMFTPLLAIFTWYYPRGNRIPRKALWLVLATMALFLTAFIADEHLIISSLTRHPDGWHAEIHKPMYLAFACYFVFYFVFAITIAVRKYRQYRGEERMRAVFYLYGILGTSIPGFVANLILPYFGDYTHIWIGPLFSTSFLVASGYSIARHRLLDVKTFLAKSALYLLTIGFLIAIYAVVIYIVVSLLLGGGSIGAEALFAANVTASLIVAFSLNPIRRWVDYWTRKVFRYQRYDSQELIDAITSICVRQTDLTVLLSDVTVQLEDAFEPKFIAFLFDDNHHGDVVHGKASARQVDIEIISKLYEHQAIEAAGGGIGQIYELATPAQKIGYFVIGSEKDGRSYRQEDERVLSMIAAELSVAIQNIFRLEEIRSFALTLEKEVNDATKELRASNAKLLEMDSAKDEFVSMASHQLRTPLTSVKGYLSMVLEGDAGNITPMQRQLLEEAFTSSERMVHLIGDFLNVSRLQTGKFVIDTHAVNLAEVVSQEVEGMRQIAATHDIKLQCKVLKSCPVLYLDEGKMRQVIMNFIDNAIYYSPEGTTVKVNLGSEDGDLVLRIVDHGMGVPKEVQAKLFTKFFRAENARKQRPDGTGIGLYLAKRIIDGHKGKLVFESELDKGSTFGFRLPIKRLSTPPKDTAETVASL